MGVVVAAEHLQLGHSVAIKVLLGDLSRQADVVARFLREARASARLKSDHAVRVTDVGELESGAPFMVMEPIEGLDLCAARSDFGPHPSQCCRGLRAPSVPRGGRAHSLGIVHRDLKPANLFLSRPTAMARRWSKSSTSAFRSCSIRVTQSVTATGAQFGSPSYMSPEQLRNSKECRRSHRRLGPGDDPF